MENIILEGIETRGILKTKRKKERGRDKCSKFLKLLKTKHEEEPEIRPRRAKIIGVFSCKGGVGKTTTVCNIAAYLTQKLKKRVLAVDANLTAPNLGLHFGELEPKVTIHDVLSGKIPIQEAVVRRHGIDAIFGSIAFREEVHLVDLRAHLEPLRSKYHVIILDSAPGLGPEVMAAMRAADEIITVTNPLLPTVASTIKTFGAAERHKVPVMGVVVNKVRGEPFELSTANIKKALGWPVLTSIPEDAKVREATASGIPVVMYAPSSPGARRFKQLSEKIHQFLFS